MEGPLTNLKESLIQFSKPRKLVNSTNPVSHTGMDGGGGFCLKMQLAVVVIASKHVG